MLEQWTCLVNRNGINRLKMCWSWRPTAFCPNPCNGQFCQRFSWNSDAVWDCYWPVQRLRYPSLSPSTTIYLLLYNHVSIKAIFLRPRAMAAGVLLLWQHQKYNNKLDQKALAITHPIISKSGYNYIPLNRRGLHKNRESGNTWVRIKHRYLYL